MPDSDFADPCQRVFIVEDDPSTRSSLAHSVQQAEGLTLGGTAGSLAEALEILGTCVPDLVLLDLRLPDGIAHPFIEHVSQTMPAVKVLVITVLGDETNVVRAIELGACGYLLKQDALRDVEHALQRVLDNESPLSPAVARHLLKKLQAQASSDIRRATDSATASTLTAREHQMLEALAQGYSYQEVADKYALSFHTVAHYVKSLYQKLEVNSRGAAVAKGVRSGLVQV